jgi:hypothetical protein
MAINVNTVYTTVLSILNKEQRGYITPDEFNKIATQVQLEIFENFFEDYNQYIRMPKTDAEFASRMERIRQEFQVFGENNTASSVSGNVYTVPLEGGVLTGTISTAGTGYSTSTVPQTTTGGSGSGCTVNTTVTGGGPGPVASFTVAATGSGYAVGDILTISGGGGNAQITLNTLTPGVHRFGSAFYETGTNSPEIQLVSKREYTQQLLSPISQPTTNFPIATYQQDKLTVNPTVTNAVKGDVNFNYIRKPANPRWGYSIGSLGQYVYDSTDYNADLLNNAGSLQSSITTNPTNKNATTTTGVTQSATSGTGTGVTVTITTTGGAGSSTVSAVTITTQGSGYSVGDTVTFAAASFGGGVGSDLIITLTASDFNSGSAFGSVQFEISDMQQTECILNILQYAGLVIRDPQVIQAATQELAQDEMNEKR